MIKDFINFILNFVIAIIWLVKFILNNIYQICCYLKQLIVKKD